MSSLNFQYQAVSTSGTGPLSLKIPQTPSFKEIPQAQEHTPSAFAPTSGTYMVQNQVWQHQSSCLEQVVLFPDADQPEPGDAIDHQAIRVSRGQHLLDNLNQRYASSSSSQSRTLDFALAKLSTQAMKYPLTLNDLKQTLMQLSQKLPGFSQTGVRLNAEEVHQFNRTLKLFGLMTDGENLFNLSVRGASQNQSGVRMPTICYQQDLEQLLDVCAALENKLQGIKFKTSSFEPVSLFNAANNSDFKSPVSAVNRRFGALDIEMSPNRFDQDYSVVLAQELLLQIQEKSTQYSELLTQGEVFIQQSAELLDRLMPQQVEVDQALEQELETNQQLQTQTEQVASSLTTLQQLSSHLSSNDFSFSEVQLSGFNQSLASFELEIKRNSSGQMIYLQAGREISEQDFKKALLKALTQQGSQLEQSRQQVAASTGRITELRTRSASLSQQIQSANQTLTSGLELVEQARTLASQNREQLIALRNDPKRWSQLSPEQQNQVLTLLAQTEEDLARAESLSLRGQDYLKRSQEQLERSHALRDRADRILESAQTLLNQWDSLLQEQRQLLNQLRAKWLDGSDLDLRVQSLVQYANDLEAILILAPGPDLSQLKQLTREWADALEAIAQEFQQSQRKGLIETQSQQYYFEQSVQQLRAQLAYHEQALENFSTQRREQFLQILTDSLSMFKHKLA